LTSGEGVIIDADETYQLNAPSLAWIPWDDQQVFRIKAGCVGYQFAIGDQVLANAIGHNPESADLRHLMDRRLVAPLIEAPETVSDAEYAFDLIVRETHRPRTGSWTMVQAQVRAILVLLWRMSGGEDMALQSKGPSLRILQHFRQLVEAHFRSRWTIKDYANSIGISTDRLHDICRRELDRTPLQLVHERVIHEARLRLERSSQTVDQVAGSLGFQDVGHFSRFFKSKVAQPPGAYRDHAIQSATEGNAVQPSSFSDWP
jgi:AraC-like DNA-binding protein